MRILEPGVQGLGEIDSAAAQIQVQGARYPSSCSD
jgi:hypothetical protein